MMTPIFNYDRALNSLLYVLNKYGRINLHKLFKTLYFADLCHIREYGRVITGDTYLAMPYGPVPSRIYDMIKIVRGDSLYSDEKKSVFQNLFSVQGKMIEAKQPATLRYLSVSDKAKLDQAIDFCKDKTFDELVDATHGEAWKKSFKNEDNRISLEDVLREVGEPEEFISYIMEKLEEDKALSLINNAKS